MYKYVYMVIFNGVIFIGLLMPNYIKVMRYYFQLHIIHEKSFLEIENMNE